MSEPLVLLADDYPDALEMYAEYLRTEGFRVVTAVDGRQAVDVAVEHRPDVIFLDLSMPELLGEEVLRILRANSLFDRVPIVALTAHAMAEHRERALEVGFDACFTKPMLPMELAAGLRRVLAEGRPFGGRGEDGVTDLTP